VPEEPAMTSIPTLDSDSTKVKRSTRGRLILFLPPTILAIYLLSPGIVVGVALRYDKLFTYYEYLATVYKPIDWICRHSDTITNFYRWEIQLVSGKTLGID
jgi:hypothetical protein